MNSYKIIKIMFIVKCIDLSLEPRKFYTKLLLAKIKLFGWVQSNLW